MNVLGDILEATLYVLFFQDAIFICANSLNIVFQMAGNITTSPLYIHKAYMD